MLTVGWIPAETSRYRPGVTTIFRLRLAMFLICFYSTTMQVSFDFGAAADATAIRDRLRACVGDPGEIERRSPIGQLVKSMISSRTYDATSLAAYDRLVARFDDWAVLAAASPELIEAVIFDVSHPDRKAEHLHETLTVIGSQYPDFDLGFLGSMAVPAALRWLEALPGVGRKVSASVLNFSVLRMPAFVVDTHVLRIVRRFGFVRPKATNIAVYDAVMDATAGWSADELAELHSLIKRLGQTICRPAAPGCAHCPIRAGCRSAAARERGEISRLGLAPPTA